MKKFIFALLCLGSFSAFSQTTVLKEFSSTELGFYPNSTSSRFSFDTDTGEVNLLFKLVDVRSRCMGSMANDTYHCWDETVSEESFSETVSGLSVSNKQILLDQAGEQIVCADLKPGRIFRRTTNIVLTGRCQPKIIQVKQSDRTAMLKLVFEVNP